MDTQGSEKLILQGGKKVLEQASIIHIETSFIKLYKNQCLFNDIYKILMRVLSKNSFSTNRGETRIIQEIIS